LGRMRPSEVLMPASGSAWPASGPGSVAGSENSGARASLGVAAPAPDGPGILRAQPETSRATETRLDDWVFSDDYGSRLLREHFGVATLAGYGLEGHALAVAAAGAILHYVRETQRGSLSHFDGVRFYEQGDSLMLDPATLRNLKL